MTWTCWIICFRNLKQLVRVPLKKGRKRNRRKRARDDSQGPRVAKQQRLNSGHRPQHINNQPSVLNSDSSSLYATSSQSTSSRFEGWSEQERDGPEDAQTTEAISSSVSLEEPTKPQEVKVKPKALKTTAGFRDLLAQMRGNSSMIIRETHYWGDFFNAWLFEYWCSFCLFIFSVVDPDAIHVAKLQHVQLKLCTYLSDLFLYLYIYQSCRFTHLHPPRAGLPQISVVGFLFNVNLF